MHLITGTFHHTSVTQVQAFLDAWIGETRRRDRLFGTTWEIGNAGLELHFEVSGPKHDVCYLDVRLDASREDCVAWIETMTHALMAADVLYLVGHQECDGLDDVGEEQSYAHPDFDRRFRQGREEPR